MPICFVGALGCALNVQRVRLARSLRAPPRSWTFLNSLPVLLLLLLLSADVGGVRDEPIGWARRDLAKYRQIDVADLFTERRDDLARHDFRGDLGLQGLLREAPEDAFVGRHVVVVAAVTHDDVVVVDRTVVGRVEGY